MTDSANKSSPGDMWILDRLAREIVAFNSDERILNLRSEFRKARRESKELLEYAIFFVKF